MSQLAEGDMVCDGCGKLLDQGVYYGCDLDIEKDYCGACFEKTDCGQGKHGEDCSTQILVSDTKPKK